MSGYLARLARRTLALGPVLRAQAASFVAPWSALADTAPSEGTEVDAVRSVAPRGAANSGEAAGEPRFAPREALHARPLVAERDVFDPAAPSDEGLRPAPPLHDPAQPGPANTRRALPEPARPLVPAPLVAVVARAGEHVLPFLQERSPAAPAVSPRAEAQRAQASRLAASMDAAPITASDGAPATAARRATSPTPLETWLDELTESSPARTRPTSSPTGPRSAARAAAARTERAERAERAERVERTDRDEPATVHVSIGRIEISAVHAPPAPAAPAARSAAPGASALSLDEYLSRRRQR